MTVVNEAKLPNYTVQDTLETNAETLAKADLEAQKANDQSCTPRTARLTKLAVIASLICFSFVYEWFRVDWWTKPYAYPTFITTNRWKLDTGLGVVGVLVFLLVTLPLIATMGINNKGKRGDCNICLTWMFAVMWFIAVIVTHIMAPIATWNHNMREACTGLSGRVSLDMWQGSYNMPNTHFKLSDSESWRLLESPAHPDAASLLGTVAGHIFRLDVDLLSNKWILRSGEGCQAPQIEEDDPTRNPTSARLCEIVDMSPFFPTTAEQPHLMFITKRAMFHIPFYHRMTEHCAFEPFLDVYKFPVPEVYNDTSPAAQTLALQRSQWWQRLPPSDVVARTVSFKQEQSDGNTVSKDANQLEMCIRDQADPEVAVEQMTASQLFRSGRLDYVIPLGLIGIKRWGLYADEERGFCYSSGYRKEDGCECRDDRGFLTHKKTAACCYDGGSAGGVVVDGDGKQIGWVGKGGGGSINRLADRSIINKDAQLIVVGWEFDKDDMGAKPECVEGRCKGHSWENGHDTHDRVKREPGMVIDGWEFGWDWWMGGKPKCVEEVCKNFSWEEWEKKHGPYHSPDIESWTRDDIDEHPSDTMV